MGRYSAHPHTTEPMSMGMSWCQSSQGLGAAQRTLGPCRQHKPSGFQVLALAFSKAMHHGVRQTVPEYWAHPGGLAGELRIGKDIMVLLQLPIPQVHMDAAAWETGLEEQH